MSVRIFKPARNAMQSGTAKSNEWVLQYEATAPRTKDPLMGWTSSSQTDQQVKIQFKSRQDAIDYARREGLAFVISKQNKPRRTRKSYSDNFKFGRRANWTH